VKIAIIGSGISGMTCGHLLAPHHEVHLFESAARVGGHTQTHEIKTSSGTYSIDTGFIVFNDRNYPNFTKLMNKFHVASKPSVMSFSVKVQKNGLEYNGTTINSLFGQRKNLLRPSFYRMISDILRFNKAATEYYINNKNDLGKTIEEYLIENNYSEDFIEHYIMPMGAAIWSAGRDEMREFPLFFFVRFFHHHGMLTVNDRPQWRVLVGGSSSYINPLTENFKKNIHLNSSVESVTRSSVGVKIEIKKNGQSSFQDFDRVIFACHGDQAIKIIKDPSEKELSVLGAFTYRPNDVILHTDTSVLPKKKICHASWNYYLPKTQKERVAVTYHMNMLQGLNAPETFLVSLNMNDLIDPEKIIKKIPYTHPVFTLDAVKSQSLWSSINGERTHFCGAYWGNGFHEDGVKSALSVANIFGVSL